MSNSSQNAISSLMAMAQRSHQSGDLTKAIQFYKEALRMAPGHPDIMQWIGLAYCGKEDFINGISFLEKAIAASPNQPVWLTNLGNAYLKTAAFDKAYQVLKKAIELNPNFDEAWHKYAQALKGINKIQEAIEAYQKTISLNPKHHYAPFNLGNLMMQLGNYKTAISFYNQSVSINPNFSSCHNNLGAALLEWDEFTQAEKHFLKAIELQPVQTDGYINLINVYEKQNKLDEIEKYSKILIELYPDNIFYKVNRKLKTSVVADSSASISVFRNDVLTFLNTLNPNDFLDIELLHKNALYPSAGFIYQGMSNNLPIMKAFDDLFVNIPKADLSNNPKNAKPHIGFVVTSGHEGVFLKCMRGLITQIDKSRFDVSVVCSLPNGKKIISETIKETNLRYIEIPNQSIIAAINTVVSANFDVLYYWEIGTDATNYFLALAKPACVQVASWGWPITSGLKSVDYFVSQKNLETEESLLFYSEKVALFNAMPVYYYKPNVPQIDEINPKIALSHPSHRYICQQNLKKVHPDFDEIVSEILKKDELAYVYFIEDKQANITELLQKRLSQKVGIGLAQRIIFLERMEEPKYLFALSQCTLALDTLYYGGGANTVYDTFAAGIPLITLNGKNHSARFASAAFKKIGLEDTVAVSVEEYVNIAVDLAQNSEKRQILSQKIKSESEALFKDKNAVEEWENFFENVVK